MHRPHSDLKLMLIATFCALAVAAVAVATIWLGVPDQQIRAPESLSSQNVINIENNTLDSSISAVDNSVKSSPRPWTLLSTGDVMLGRSVNSTGYRRGNFAWSLVEVDEHLADFDLVVANLETPIITGCPIRDDGMLFCADASAAGVLAASNIDIVTLANNHIYNQGSDGYAQTVGLLTQAGETYVDDENLYTWEQDGVTYGLLAYDDVTFPIESEAWQELISHAAAQVDALIVAVHWGYEYQYQPNSRQVELAHLAIDAGATLILGNHSHWLGTVESYHDGAIIYSHGNFIFDQEWAPETKRGLAAAWHWDGPRVTSVDLYPIHITNYGLAHWEAGTALGDQILQTFLTESGNGTLVDDHVTIKFD